MAKLSVLFIFLLLSVFGVILAQELPEDAIEVNLNTYFDNFGVNIIYPTVSVNKQITENTGINGRYLVDVITAASMRSHFDKVYSTVNIKHGIDALSSASTRTHGGNDSYPDEIRHEFGIGISQIIGDVTVSANNLYSTEHDYTSETFAVSASVPFAKKNFIVNLGLVKSWDRIFPQTRSWTEKKDVITMNFGLSQIFSLNFLAQADFSYSQLNGFLSDPYQVVTVVNFDSSFYALYESIVPDTRKRYAVGVRGIYRLGDKNSMTLGYRYYFDDWGIKSQTVSGLFQQQFSDDNILLGAGLRAYYQSKADFFKENYTYPEKYMTVDSKFNASNSYEIELKAVFNGSIVPLIYNEKIELKAALNYYIRTTDSPDWHSRYTTLYAIISSLGFKYLF